MRIKFHGEDLCSSSCDFEMILLVRPVMRVSSKQSDFHVNLLVSTREECGGKADGAVSGFCSNSQRALFKRSTEKERGRDETAERPVPT